MFANSSGEHRASVSRMSRECRATFANDSCDNRTRERFKSNIDLRYQIKVSAVKFRKKCKVYETNSLV